MEQSLKILIVDDDPLSRQLLARSLQHAGYDVLECHSGVEALQVLENSGPALLVLDYQMPELNGAQICELIRADNDPEIAQVPIILLTAHSNTEHEIECLKAGANDFVTKPVNTAVLRARLDTHLRIHTLREKLREQNVELEAWRRTHELDLEAARLTQQAILPTRMPELAGWEFAAHYDPLIQVGGDLYDWIKAPDGRLFVWISDATGHGASAALLTTLSKLLFRHAITDAKSPASVMESVHSEFLAVFKSRTFMTAACLMLDDRNMVHFCGAGHPPGLVVRRDGKFEELKSEAPPLGIEPRLKDCDRSVALNSGDAVLLFTDGLYEISNPQGEQITLAALPKLIVQPDGSAHAWLDTILKKAHAHAQGAPLHDDIAIFAAVRG